MVSGDILFQFLTELRQGSEIVKYFHFVFYLIAMFVSYSEELEKKLPVFFPLIIIFNLFIINKKLRVITINKVSLFVKLFVELFFCLLKNIK